MHVIIIINRALAKTTEGDFGKFVENTAKPRDMAQKWRAFKNIARLFKNPFGYVYWKVHPLVAQNRIRFSWLLLIYHLTQSFALWLAVKNRKSS